MTEEFPDFPEVRGITVKSVEHGERRVQQLGRTVEGGEVLALGYNDGDYAYQVRKEHGSAQLTVDIFPWHRVLRIRETFPGEDVDEVVERGTGPSLR